MSEDQVQEPRSVKEKKKPRSFFQDQGIVIRAYGVLKEIKKKHKADFNLGRETAKIFDISDRTVHRYVKGNKDGIGLESAEGQVIISSIQDTNQTPSKPKARSKPKPKPKANKSLQPKSAAVDTQQIKSLREDLLKWIPYQHNAPILVRLAWHDSGTYDKDSTKPWPLHGGADASIRFAPEIDHGANAGLAGPVEKLNPFHEKYQNVSYADLYQLASVVAIETSGGPHIPIRFGRLDCASADLVVEEGNLPSGRPPFPKTDSPIQHLKNVFYRMGLSDKEITVLSGAHTLGRAYKSRSGATDRDATKYTEDVKEGMTKGGQSWTKDWLKFDNSYFVELKRKSDKDLLVMETDDALTIEPEFKKWVDLYAEDQEAFFNDYIPAQIKLSELGSKWVDDKPVEIQF